MPNWFNWIANSKLQAAADYTLSGGRLLRSDAKEVLFLLSQESSRLIPQEMGSRNYNEYYPTNRHGQFWGRENPCGVVDHYTAGISSGSTLLWFSNKLRSKGIKTSSAHFIIGRDGIIFCVVPLVRIAWHAPGVNSTHFGIEHVNAGVLRRKTKKSGYLYRGAQTYPKERAGAVQEVAGECWEPYTANQIISNIVLKRWLITAFPEIEQQSLIDHQNISPGRKRDCGPMWPLNDLNAIVFCFENCRILDWHEGQAIRKQDLVDLRAYAQEALDL